MTSCSTARRSPQSRRASGCDGAGIRLALGAHQRGNMDVLNMRHTFDDNTARELEAIVGGDHVSRRETDLLTYSVDSYWMPQMWLDRGERTPTPDVIVHPGTTGEVSAVLRLANRRRIPVIPWGGGSGTQGGALPIHGGIMLDMKRMNRILEINERSF